MKTIMIMTVVLATSSYLGAGDSLSMTLGKVLAAVEHAHRTHTLAKQSCAVPKHHEIGWDVIEKDTRDLANAQPEPKVSEMFLLMDAIREERSQLFLDHMACGAKSEFDVMTSIQDDMLSLDDAAFDLEESMRERVQNLELVIERFRKQTPPK